jgi:hypothetical protein
MRSRKDILIDLVHLNGSLSDLSEEISHYSWDAKEPILVVDKITLSNILKRAIDNIITYNELEDWANAIECRDDLNFADDKLQEIIVELANPELNEKITTERLQEIVGTLE